MFGGVCVFLTCYNCLMLSSHFRRPSYSNIMKVESDVILPKFVMHIVT